MRNHFMRRATALCQSPQIRRKHFSAHINALVARNGTAAAPQAQQVHRHMEKSRNDCMLEMAHIHIYTHTHTHSMHTFQLCQTPHTLTLTHTTIM